MTQALAFGGEGMEGIDPAKKYRSSLQNYVIDTGNEVIPVDTGVPAETPDQVPDEKTFIYMGKKIDNYVDALAKAGYKPEQVSKILITHKHADHTGELRNFPNAKIYAAGVETQATGKYVCSVCGYVYDPAENDGVSFEDLPDDWKCPRCRQGKEKFNRA